VILLLEFVGYSLFLELLHGLEYVLFVSVVKLMVVADSNLGLLELLFFIVFLLNLLFLIFIVILGLLANAKELLHVLR